MIARIPIVIRTGEHGARAVGRSIAKHERKIGTDTMRGWGRVLYRAQKTEREKKE